MSATKAWLLGLGALIVLILVLDHMGVNAPGDLAAGVRTVEHALNHPL